MSFDYDLSKPYGLSIADINDTSLALLKQLDELVVDQDDVSNTGHRPAAVCASGH